MTLVPCRIPVLAALFLVPAALLLGPPAQAATTRNTCVGPGAVFSPVPWPQRLWDVERAWSVSRGAGVTVAVLSSGVDAGQQQLKGKVLPGRSFLPGDPPGPRAGRDCAGWGTGYASVIAAQPGAGSGFEGLAPAARILPVAVSETDRITTDQNTGADGGTPQGLADGIAYASEAGADVIFVGCYLTDDVPAVRAAVRAAVDAGAVVVAPVGDLAQEGDPVTYPAAYDGVLGVGGMRQDMGVLSTSEAGDDVDLVAPGDNVVTSAVRRGHAAGKGTPVAAAFAAATAALVVSAQPSLTPAQVVTRLRRTAAPFGTTAPTSVGAGLLDPARAVTEKQAGEASPAEPARVAFAPYPAPETDRRPLMAIGAGLGFLGVAVLFIGAVTLRRGRRRHWRPGTPAGPTAPDPATVAPTVPRSLFSTESD